MAQELGNYSSFGSLVGKGISVKLFAPFDVTAQLFVADAFNTLIANIFTPKSNDTLNLAQHVDPCAPLRLLSLT